MFYIFINITYNIFICTLLESFFFNEIFAKLFLLVLVGCQNIIAGFFKKNEFPLSAVAKFWLIPLPWWSPMCVWLHHKIEKKNDG